MYFKTSVLWVKFSFFQKRSIFQSEVHSRWIKQNMGRRKKKSGVISFSHNFFFGGFLVWKTIGVFSLSLSSALRKELTPPVYDTVGECFLENRKKERKNEKIDIFFGSKNSYWILSRKKKGGKYGEEKEEECCYSFSTTSFVVFETDSTLSLSLSDHWEARCPLAKIHFPLRQQEIHSFPSTTTRNFPTAQWSTTIS